MIFSLLDPRLWLAVALACAGAYGAGRWHQWQADSERAAALQAERERTVAREQLRRAETNMEVTNAYRNRADSASAAASEAAHESRLGRAESDRLRDELAARDRASAAASRIADEAAATALELFGECRERRADVARAAGELAAQVGGLQDFVERVCVAAAPPATTAKE